MLGIDRHSSSRHESLRSDVIFKQSGNHRHACARQPLVHWVEANHRGLAAALTPRPLPVQAPSYCARTNHVQHLVSRRLNQWLQTLAIPSSQRYSQQQQCLDVSRSSGRVFVLLTPLHDQLGLEVLLALDDFLRQHPPAYGGTLGRCCEGDLRVSVKENDKTWQQRRKVSGRHSIRNGKTKSCSWNLGPKMVRSLWITAFGRMSRLWCRGSGQRIEKEDKIITN